MTSRRKPFQAQLRRSISEQLRDSTARAWDLLWRNVRERRLAGRCPGSAPLGAGGVATGRLLRPILQPPPGVGSGRRCAHPPGVPGVSPLHATRSMGVSYPAPAPIAWRGLRETGSRGRGAQASFAEGATSNGLAAALLLATPIL